MHWHDPNRHDSLTVLLTGGVCFIVGFILGTVVIHYVLVGY